MMECFWEDYVAGSRGIGPAVPIAAAKRGANMVVFGRVTSGSLGFGY
jgi:hypothetical protein